MNSKIRILHIGLSPNVGGIETVVHSWWMKADKEKYFFDFTNVYNEKIAFEDEFRHAGCNIYHLPKRSKNPIKAYLALRKVIERGNYDYIHCHVMSLSDPTPAIIASKYSSAEIIIHSHVVVDEHMPYTRRFMHVTGKLRLRNIPYKKIACGENAGLTMFESSDFQIIENGVDVDSLRFNEKNRRDIRQRYGIRDEIVIGHIGRPGAPKNYPFLLDTYKKLLVLSNKKYKLMLVGGVDQDEAVQSKIQSLGLEHDVICTGKVSDIPAYLSAMDIFFFPSLYEGLSVSVIEAQAAGLPCLISENVDKSSAISKLVKFVSILDSEAVANILKKTEINTTDRINTRICPEYDICNSATKMLNIYSQIDLIERTDE